MVNGSPDASPGVAPVYSMPHWSISSWVKSPSGSWMSVPAVVSEVASVPVVASVPAGASVAAGALLFAGA